MPPYTAYIAITNHHSLLDVTYFLRSKGFYAITSTAEFLSVVGKHPVHILIFDTETFFTSGTNIIQACRQHNNLPGFPMIFISDKYELNNSESDDNTHERLYGSFKLNELEKILNSSLNEEGSDKAI